MPLMNPFWSAWKRTPTSIDWLSGDAFGAGASLAWKMLHGQVAGSMVTLMLVPGVWRLPLSSTARAITVAAPGAVRRHVYVQLLSPIVGCQVAPPSREISTPPTVPPPVSLAVPLML